MPDYEILVVTGNKDHNTDTELTGIETGKWNSIVLPGMQQPVQVWYEAKENVTKGFFLSILHDKRPDVIYLNGMFSYRFVVIPLLAARAVNCSVVVCPRGMLQAGALAGKAFKKKIYLFLLAHVRLVKNITWHATNEEESLDILKVFGNVKRVVVAANIPRAPYSVQAPATKNKGSLRLVYVSLIAAKKNLLQVIELVNNNAAISLDIYGPVKDKAYWQSCEQAITADAGRIQYKGELSPSAVQEKFCKYDASVLLTKGENFGHALYECLSVGRPVITSYFTPWKELEAGKAGWNLDISDNQSCQDRLTAICSLDAAAFAPFCDGAIELAKKYFAAASDLQPYHSLFSNK